jgi:hypothetical protein
MRRVIGSAVAVLAVVAALAPSSPAAGSPAASDEAAIDVGAVIRHPPRPIVRQLRSVLPVVGDLPELAVAVPVSLGFTAPPCPRVRPAGPIPRAKVARAFLVESDEGAGSLGGLVFQVLAYRSPDRASDALAAWFQQTAIDCARYRADDFFGAELEPGLAVIVTNQRTEAPVRLGDERRAIRTRVVLRSKAGRSEVTDGVGVAYRHGRYLLFAESTGVFGSPLAGPQPNLQLLRSASEVVFDRIEALPGRTH